MSIYAVLELYEKSPQTLSLFDLATGEQDLDFSDFLRVSCSTTAEEGTQGYRILSDKSPTVFVQWKAMEDSSIIVHDNMSGHSRLVKVKLSVSRAKKVVKLQKVFSGQILLVSITTDFISQLAFIDLKRVPKNLETNVIEPKFFNFPRWYWTEQIVCCDHGIYILDSNAPDSRGKVIFLELLPGIM